MEKEARNHYHTRGSSRGGGGGTAAERDLLLQWGNRKRLRCVKVQRRDVEAPPRRRQLASGAPPPRQQQQLRSTTQLAMPITASPGNAYMLEYLNGEELPKALNGRFLKRYYPSVWQNA